ncbi:MAG: pitrilysin family protein [Myxococcota bacterium]
MRGALSKPSASEFGRPRCGWHAGIGVVVLLGMACTSRADIPPPRQPLVLTPPESFREVAPELPPLRPITVPVVQRSQLANGLEVLVVEDHRSPLVEISYVSRRAGRYTVESRRGLPLLVLGLLADQLGHDAGAVVLTEAGGLAVSTLAEDYEEVLEDLARVLIHPDYNEARVLRARDRRATYVHSISSSAAAAARDQARRRVYGDRHPAGAPASGVASAIEELRFADVLRFHLHRLSAADAAIIVCGDVDVAEVRATVERRFGRWQPRPPPERDRPTAPVALEQNGQVDILDRASEQAHIAIAYPAPPDADHEDQLRIGLLTNILVGGMTSRLTAPLREHEGLTYGVQTGVEWRHDGAVWYIEAAVDLSRVGRAVELLLREQRRLAQEPVTEAELASAKVGYREGLARRVESVGAVVFLAIESYVLRRTVDAIVRRDAELAAVSVEDLQATAARLLSRDPAVAVAGPVDELRGPLQDVTSGVVMEVVDESRALRAQ